MIWSGHWHGNRGLVNRRGRFWHMVILAPTSNRSPPRKRRRNWFCFVVTIDDDKGDDEVTLSALHSLLFHLCLRTDLPCSYRSLSFPSPFFLRVSNSFWFQNHNSVRFSIFFFIFFAVVITGSIFGGAGSTGGGRSREPKYNIEFHSQDSPFIPVSYYTLNECWAWMLNTMITPALWFWKGIRGFREACALMHGSVSCVSWTFKFISLDYVFLIEILFTVYFEMLVWNRKYYGCTNLTEVLFWWYPRDWK